MTFKELQEKISQDIYIEDDGMTRVALAGVIITRLQIGNPVWLIIIGASSSGKSQILRPLALTDSNFIHRLDDMTENTLISGMRVKKGEEEISFLRRIGKLGIIVISDLTVIFSKSAEVRNAILSQFRMVYDGEITKMTGSNSKPLLWKGAIGILAGSTPSIYQSFEEVADMGERFIHYRMRPYDVEKATRVSLSRKEYGKGLDKKMSDVYAQYIKEVTMGAVDIPLLPDTVRERIIFIAMFASLLSTPTHYDKYQKVVDKIPVPAMPMRVALQLTSLATGLMIMHHHDTEKWEVSGEDIGYVEWCAYSLANEERRGCLKIVAGVGFDESVSASAIGDLIGLPTQVINISVQHLAAVGILKRVGEKGRTFHWSFKNKKDWEIVRRLEHITEDVEMVEKGVSDEDVSEYEEYTNIEFEKLSKKIDEK